MGVDGNIICRFFAAPLIPYRAQSTKVHEQRAMQSKGIFTLATRNTNAVRNGVCIVRIPPFVDQQKWCATSSASRFLMSDLKCCCFCK